MSKLKVKIIKSQAKITVRMEVLEISCRSDKILSRTDNKMAK